MAWTEDCILSEILNNAEILANPAARPFIAHLQEWSTTSATFEINSAKLYVAEITLSINEDIKFFNIKGFKKITFWNKYGFETSTQPKNNNLNYMIHPTFRNINSLSLLLFKNGNIDPTRNSFDKYYIVLVKIKDFNALIDNETFFDQTVKRKQEAYEKRVEMSKNDDFTTGNLLNILYHKKAINFLV